MTLLLHLRVQQLACERHQLFKPERFVAKLGSQFADFVRLRIVEVVVAGYDGHRGVGQPGDGSNGAEELEPARQRHAKVENHGMRPMGLGEVQPLVC